MICSKPCECRGGNPIYFRGGQECRRRNFCAGAQVILCVRCKYSEKSALDKQKITVFSKNSDFLHYKRYNITMNEKEWDKWNHIKRKKCR